MSGTREWWVQVSLDDLSDSLDQLETTEERGQWLEGFRVGSRGHVARDDWSRFKRMGFDFGVGCHEEAIEFRAQRASAGRASASARKAKYGAAQPNSVRTDLERISNGSRTGFERAPERAPERTPNQLTANSQQPTANKEQPANAGGQAGKILCKDWEPDSNHANICSFHKLSLEMQLERFRVKFAAEPMDAPEGWNRRFLGWLARGRPEATFSPIAPTPKPLPAFIQSQITVKEGEKRKYEAQGRTQSAKEVQREIDQLKGGTP